MKTMIPLTPRDEGFIMLSSHLGDPKRPVLTPKMMVTIQQKVAQSRLEDPDEVLTAARMGYLVEHGEALTIPRSEAAIVRALDAQKEAGKSIYGCGLLLSRQKTAERIRAERAAVERAEAEAAAAVADDSTRWHLSDREQAIVEQLSRGEGVTP